MHISKKMHEDYMIAFLSVCLKKYQTLVYRKWYASEGRLPMNQCPVAQGVVFEGQGDRKGKHILYAI